MTEAIIAQLMQVHCDAGAYAVRNQLPVDFHSSFYDNLPFDTLKTLKTVEGYSINMYCHSPFVGQEEYVS